MGVIHDRPVRQVNLARDEALVVHFEHASHRDHIEAGKNLTERIDVETYVIFPGPGRCYAFAHGLILTIAYSLHGDHVAQR